MPLLSSLFKKREQRRESIRVVKAKVLLNSTMLSQKKLVQNNRKGVSVRTSMLLDELEDVSMIFSAPLTKPNEAVEDDWKNVAFFVNYWNMTDQQEFAFLEVRDRLLDVQHPFNRPNVVVRYVRARKFNVPKAEAMFRAMVVWRVTNGIDSMLQDYTPPPELLHKYPGAILKGTDIDGDPIFVGRPGATDIPGMLDEFGYDQMMKFELYWRESVASGKWIEDWQKQSGRPLHLANIILDLRGFNRKMMASQPIKVQREAASVSQENYPETTKKIIILGAPSCFMFIWSMAKNCFDPGVLAKVEICGSSDFLEVLEKYMDLNVLPPCINPNGHGEAVESMPPNFEGGKIR
mmetsp:Transcript_12593/g.20997  ORF Transcript_12593/g.20997 Transcript_12593/m.20997 type:complete len:349 (-) Transcript_12593:69-1115(-)